MMSNMSPSDYDKKYQEDLEKAQALSLESLALEKFRQEKQRNELQNSKLLTPQPGIGSIASKEQNVSKSLNTERQRPRHYSKATQRPRPNCIEQKQISLPKIPPPVILRRDSTSASSWESSATSDLISFHSNSTNNVLGHSSAGFLPYEQESSRCNTTENSELFVLRRQHSSLNKSSISNLSHSISISGDVKNFHPSSCPLKSNFDLKDINLQNNEIKTSMSGNLIDFNAYSSDCIPSKDKNVRVSLLEAFDPLVSCNNHYDSPKDVIYESYDPFDFLYSTIYESSTSTKQEPIYSTITKTTSSPVQSTAPPLPPRNSTFKKDATKKVKTRCILRLYENIMPVEKKTILHDPDIIAFHSNVKRIREKYNHNDILTNKGIVISPKIENSYKIDTSIKLVIHCSSLNIGHPITLTCDVNSSIEHILMHIVCDLDSDNVENFILKVYGLSEYLESNTLLAEYEYVHNCIKLEKDVELSIHHKDKISRKLLRTEDDDKFISLAELLPKEPVQPISYESLLIGLETLEKEIGRIISASRESTESFSNIQPQSVLQAVKAVCALLGNIETLQITQALENLVHACEEFPISQASTRNKLEILDDAGNYSVVVFRDESFSDLLSQHCDNIRSAVQGLIKMYCHMFRADFQIVPQHTPTASKSSSELSESILLYIGSIHRISQKWNADEFFIEAQLFHGTRPVSSRVSSQPVMLEASTSPYKRAIFDTWLNFEGINTFQSISVSALPRESRVVITIIGQKTIEEAVQKNELGWAALQLFNYNGELAQGSFLLPFWEGERCKRLGPAPSRGTHPYGDTDPVIGIELQDFGCDIVFPKIEIKPTTFEGLYDFCSLDLNTQQQLLEIINQDTFSNPKEVVREIMWEKRHYLLNHPQALPKVLLAAHSWDYSCLQDLHSMLYSWAPLDPVSALQLLLPCFADNEVRTFAASCISKLKSDELVDYLPQIVQALKYENYDASALSTLLLERSLCSPRVAHYLYWLLVQELPGAAPQNSCDMADKSLDSESRYFRRLQLVLRALWALSGEALRKTFVSQDLLVKSMTDIAESVKQSKESTRLNVLMEGLHVLHKSLSEHPTCLPLSPSLYVTGIQVKSSSYFSSNTLPLKINFTSDESTIIPAIFKAGDDLRQDMLTLQMIRIMNKLWLKEGLDLKIVTFACVPTGYKKGMIEMVPEAETLRKIHSEFGVTGSFKEWPIAEWLAKHNPSALDYERAVANFTASCAGYCVATYVLGIGDRHNDNIMLKTSGHLFHIDFGKFLGDVQMFGNFKRDRTPFVLTSDMAYVINGGDKPSAKFHNFVDLCCNAFNIVRKQGNILLNLFGLMASSGASGLTIDSVRYVQNALLLDRSNAEAAAEFARMIQSSLKSWFTQFNFFLHNLAQLRFTGDHNDDELLSFVPKRYSMSQEGRLKSVEVYGYQKRYDPEKYYLYILKVERVNQRDPSYLFRSFKEFCEFQQKLCLLFPLTKFYSLAGSGIHVGRLNIKQVADKRMHDIKKFLQSLFNMADEICHSDLIYTFFHPLLRDQQESSIHEQKLKDQKSDSAICCSSQFIKGQIKLSFHYQRETLWVMVQHVKELPKLSGGQEPSTYVKVYLLPDPIKATKRKTKVVRKNCHPSFMETLEYRMPIEIVQQRYLQATVWNHDTLQENEFLGGTTINLADFDLTKEITKWYLLGNVSRRLIGNLSTNY